VALPPQVGGGGGGGGGLVWRVARNVIAGTWLIAGWDDIKDVGEWALARWVWFALGLALVFLTVRALIPWLEERSRRAS
jgi:hypothetical protein